MKTINEQIAEKMGWDCDAVGFYDNKTGWICSFEELRVDIYFAKLIQAQLKKEGWTITIIDDLDGIRCMAYKKHVLHWVDMQEEPAAIVALACKIWGIHERD